MKTIIIGFMLIISVQVIYGQNYEKVMVYNQDPYNLYAARDEDSTNLFYYKFVPDSKPIGVLVILSGGGERIEDVMKQISLHQLAVKENILVIFPSINWGTNTFYHECKFLDTIFQQIVNQYGIAKNKFILGGFSSGAMVSLTYSEKANMNFDSTFVKPKAVFGIDPPLDYANLWYRSKRNVERNCSEVAVREGKWIMDDLSREFGGPPDKSPENYIKYSIYSHSENDGGNAKYLITTPVRIYTEPGIIWQMENRHNDLYDLNCTDISAMINLLQLNGNKEAEMVVTNDKGRRLNGQKHPHSWSIMNAEDCLNWILKQLNK